VKSMSNLKGAILAISLFLIVVGIGKGWFKGFGEKVANFVAWVKSKLGKE